MYLICSDHCPDVLRLQQRVRSPLRRSLRAVLHWRGELQQTGAAGASEGQVQAHPVPQNRAKEYVQNSNFKKSITNAN